MYTNFFVLRAKDHSIQRYVYLSFLSETTPKSYVVRRYVVITMDDVSALSPKER